MPTSMPSVADRIAQIKLIFADFGIEVYPHSSLDLLIHAEFGSGKRSVLNKILAELNEDSDAAALSRCIGEALEREISNPEIDTVATIMQQRLPSLFRILDIRQQTGKRLQLLEDFLAHFEQKIANKQTAETAPEQLDRLQRMLSATRQQLHNQITLQSFSLVAEEVGVIFAVRDLKRCGRILHTLIPVLIALDQADMSSEQKINHCIRGLAALGQELADPKLAKIAKVLDNIHWLARISLPNDSEHATIEQALQNMHIPLGSITTQQLRSKAQTHGLHEKELVQIFYHHKLDARIASNDQTLIDATHKNQQYAAACGYITQLGQDLECKELEQVGIAGICLASMRQTYCEFKTSNLNLVNLSESLGLILSTAGTLSGNRTMVKIGQCVLDGVSAYAGLMAIPGAQSIAIPMAVCTTLAKMILNNKTSRSQETTRTPEIHLHHIFQQISILHSEMRHQFSHLHQQLEAQHIQLLACIDKGFVCILNYTQHCHILNMQGLNNIEIKLEQVQISISKSFTDLYLEHVYEPIQEIQYYAKYQPEKLSQLKEHQHKLSMWLLYKSKNRKANGRELSISHENTEEYSYTLSTILINTTEYGSILGLINRYINLEFQQALPEDIPHVPSWLVAAETYIQLMHNVIDQSTNTTQQVQLIQDIINSGEQICNYLQNIASNMQLWELLRQRQNTLNTELNACILTIINQINPHCLKSSSVTCQLAADRFVEQTIYAQAAPPEQQLEYFDPIRIDITNVWHNYLAEHIPTEVYLAQEYGIGQIQIEYTLDPVLNGFTSLRLAHNYGQLPDHARDVIFRIDVGFKFKGETISNNLISGFFVHDLHTAQRRFDEYYNQKFKYGLRHSRYLWISLDGRRNQVVNNGETDTHKLIDFSRLAQVYYSWWQNVQPINAAEIQNRLRHNSGFMQAYSYLIEHNLCVSIDAIKMQSIKINLLSLLQQHVFTQRASISATLLESKAIAKLIDKQAAYRLIYTVLCDFMHVSVPKPRLQSEFKDLILMWQQPQNWHLEYESELKRLLNSPSDQREFNYQQSDMYLKVKSCIDSLMLLAVNLQTQSFQGTPQNQLTF